MSEIKGCMNCGNISCSNNKKRESAGCGRYISPEDKIKELEEKIEKMKNWGNCKNYISCLEECCRKNISFEKGICYNCKKWEIKEK